MNNLTPSKRIPNLTPIRFILALLVVIFHISQFSNNRNMPFLHDLAIFYKGTEAVYMFFSLSGFLIIKQLYDEKKQTGSIHLKNFYFRRILRIFPLYYLILSFGFLYYRLVLPYIGYDIENNYNLWSGLLLSATFFPNIFSTYSPGGIIEILWSIGIEEQFYLFIAPIFLLLPIKKIVPFLVLFTSVYFVLFNSKHLVLLQHYQMLFFFFSFSGLCAILIPKRIFKTVISKLRYPILLLVLLYFTTNIFKNNLVFWLYHLLSCILFGLAISALSVKPIKILQNKTLNYLGKISYGIYVYHAIAMQLIAYIYLTFISKLELKEPINIIIINSTIIGLTIVISHFSYKYYESYFLKFKQKLRVRSTKK